MSDNVPVFLIVDDHALYRTGLAMMLEQAWPDARLVQASTLAEGLACAREQTPDMVLLDVQLPDGQGPDSLDAWRAVAPRALLLLMSAEVDGALLAHARAAGIAGVVHKAATLPQMLASVKEAMALGSSYATVPYSVLTPAGGPSEATLVAHARDAQSGFQPSPLQSRILGYLGRGTPNKAIARQVGLSEMQVRAEVSWLTEALGAASREEAYLRAQERGWVGP